MRSATSIILSLALLGCSPADQPDAGSTAPRSEAPSEPSSEPIASGPAESAAASGAACTPPDLCGSELAPGTYRSLISTTTVEFTVDAGWVGTQYDDLGFELRRAGDGPPQLFSGAPYDGTVFSDVCSGDGTEEIDPTAAAFGEFIAARPGIEVIEGPAETTIGGRSAVQLEVNAVDPGCTSDPPERLWLWMLLEATDFHLNVGERARIIAVDAGEAGAVVFVVESFAAEDFDALIGAAEPVLATITFE